jgi:hypothetical protein
VPLETFLFLDDDCGAFLSGVFAVLFLVAMRPNSLYLSSKLRFP